MPTLPIENKLLERIKEEEMNATHSDSSVKKNEKKKSDLTSRSSLVSQGYFYPTKLTSEEIEELKKETDKQLDAHFPRKSS